VVIDMRFAILLIVPIIALVSCATNYDDALDVVRHEFREPKISRKGVEAYRLFWSAKRSHPLAISVFKASNSKIFIELKTNSGFSTYTSGSLDKHKIATISEDEYIGFKNKFQKFSELISDDGGIVRAAMPGEAGDDDTIIICSHSSGYVIEVKNSNYTHIISRNACNDLYGIDMSYVAPFIVIAHKYFPDELAIRYNFEYYPLLKEIVESPDTP
jgi:hypothetical protein